MTLIYSVVNDNLKLTLRERFISNFIDTEHNYYKEYINTLKKYKDGMCYDGYLWDVLNEPFEKRLRTQEETVEFLKKKDDIYVMWDIYSNYRVNMDDIIRLNNPKDTVITVDPSELIKYIENEWNNYDRLDIRYLPSDIYAFDNSMNWCVVFTHECLEDITIQKSGKDEFMRICFIINRS